MTRVEFFDQDGRITGFSCSGHSGYAEEGSEEAEDAVIFEEGTFEEMDPLERAAAEDAAEAEPAGEEPAGDMPEIVELD